VKYTCNFPKAHRMIIDVATTRTNKRGYFHKGVAPGDGRKVNKLAWGEGARDARGDFSRPQSGRKWKSVC